MNTLKFQKNSFYCIIAVLLLTLLSITGCKKNQDAQPAPPQQPEVIISSISPDTGPYSTIVIIRGSGFNANAVSNTVKFNDKDAVVQSASATQLVVVVPKAAGSGPVTVQTGGKKGIGPIFNFINTITVSTLAGNGVTGFADGYGTIAQFDYPSGVAKDAQGNIYVADFYNNRIRKIAATGVVSTLAGNGTAGFANGNGSNAQFYGPYGVACDPQGNIYVADYYNDRIRKITAMGVVSTLAGNGTAGFADGNGNTSKFSHPTGVACDAQGNIYVADLFNNRIRKITAIGVVSTLAGDGTAGFADGNGSNAQFDSPYGVACDAHDNIYVADTYNNRIRKITATGVVSTLAGNGTAGFADGTENNSKFYYPTGVTIDVQGNIYVADYKNNRIRKVTATGVVSTLAGNGTVGFADGNENTAKFYYPAGLTIDTEGTIYVADIKNNRVRKITVE